MNKKQYCGFKRQLSNLVHFLNEAYKFQNFSYMKELATDIAMISYVLIIEKCDFGEGENVKAGDKVRWLSYMDYDAIERTGTVIAVVPKGESANEYIPATAKKSHIKYDYDVSSIDRVLVAVSAGKNGQITHYYGRPINTVEVITNE